MLVNQKFRIILTVVFRSCPHDMEEIRSSSEVPFKYWTGTLVLDIYGRGSQTPGRVEIELTSPDEGARGRRGGSPGLI